MALGAPDASGRRRPEPMAGTEFIIECDRVLLAIGQGPDLTWASRGADGVGASKQRRLAADASHERSASVEANELDGYFAQLGGSSDSSECQISALATESYHETDESLDGFLQDLEDIFATSEDSLESIR